MNIYLVNQSCGPLFIDIANAIEKSGANTILITGEINPVQKQLCTNIKVIHLNRYNRSSIIFRLISWVLFTFFLLFKILFSKPKSIWLVSTNPPLAPWLYYFLKIKKNKLVLLIYDIYPEALLAGKIISKEHVLFNLWHTITQKTYKNADKIICIGDSMSEFIKMQNISLSSKIYNIPNWNIIDFEMFQENKNKYRIKRNAQDKIHLVYSGNLGATHDYSTILKAAELLKNDPRFVFTIIGEGFQKEKIKGFIENNQLINMLWEPFKEASEVPDVFLSADIFLITLGSGLEKVSIPSKTYDALASGAAILIVAPEGSELEKLVRFGQAGGCFQPGEVRKIVGWLKQLADEKKILENHKLAAKKLSKKYSSENANKYVTLLTSI